MQYVTINKENIPEESPRRPYKKLKKELSSLLLFEWDAIEILYSEEEYRNPNSCFQSIYGCVHRNFREAMVVRVREGHIYLIRK